MFAKQTKELAHRFGLDVSHYRPLAARVVARLNEGVPLVVDVGACGGEFVRGLRQHGYRGDVISFEPVEEAFEQLAAAAGGDDRWTCHRVALGAVRGEASINVASNLASSSLLEMEDGHRSAAPWVSVIGVETVRVAPLDEVIDDRRPCMLKLDVQGYEHRVLDGAPETLRRTVLLQSELSLGELYADQASFQGLVERLYEAGFDLVDLDPCFRDRADGRVLSIDGLFARRPPARSDLGRSS